MTEMTEDARLGRVNPFALALCAAVLGLVISVCAWLSVSATDERLALQVFSENATNNEMALESGLDRYSHNLVALGALFESTRNAVTREEFDSFSRTLLKGQAAILGVGWIPRVGRNERAAYELAARQDGIADYHIRNAAPDGNLSIAPQQDEYFPIY